MGEHRRPQFVLFGASMTQFSFEEGGWGAALQNRFQRKADVLLRGYSGWNTRRALQVLNSMFPKDASIQPALVVVFFGTNDAAVPLPSKRGQAVPIEEFKDNLVKVARHLKGLSDTTRVILVTPPPIHEESRRNYLSAKFPERPAGWTAKYPDRTSERACQYAAASKAAAAEAGVSSVDLWTKIQESTPHWESCLTDGMHLSSGGSKVLFDELTTILEESEWHPPLAWESMQADFDAPSVYDYIHPFQDAQES